MSKVKVVSSIRFKEKPKRSNKGIYAKTKQSTNKTSKNYFKKSRGQG